jgi:hypothetical protein
MTYLALEKVIVIVALTVLLQIFLGVIRRATFVTSVRFLMMTGYNVSLQPLLVIKMLQAERTRGSHFI